MRKYSKDEEEPKPKFIPFKVIGDYIYEAVSYCNRPVFLCYDFKEKNFTIIKTEIEIAGEKFAPAEQSLGASFCHRLVARQIQPHHPCVPLCTGKPAPPCRISTWPRLCLDAAGVTVCSTQLR